VYRCVVTYVSLDQMWYLNVVSSEIYYFIEKRFRQNLEYIQSLYKIVISKKWGFSTVGKKKNWRI